MQYHLVYALVFLLSVLSLMPSVDGCFANIPQRFAHSPACVGTRCSWGGRCDRSCSCRGRNWWCSGYCG
uniref:Putative secreted protein n=1 Tax=Amblyomma triste TaxID=251400 RepID=A0A023GCC2_AMBTT